MTVHILGISGSLRKDSFNTALIRAAIELKPAGVELETADIGSLLHYDDDVYAKGFRRRSPRSAISARRPTRSSSRRPSTTGVLKNAIDWASRPPSQPFAGKVLGIVGATPYAGGTVRAQVHLRAIAVFLDLRAVNKPEVLVRNAKDSFDQSKLTDEVTKKLLAQLLEAMVTYSKKLKG
jgi:chromate reductase